MGYHALTAVRLFPEKPSLVIFEPSLELFSLSLRYLDLTPLLSYPYLDLYVGSEINIRQNVEKYISPMVFGGAQLLSCFPPLPFFNSSYGSGYNFLQEWLKSKQESRVTLERSSRKIFQNTIENLPSLFAGQSLGCLRDALKGLPAFCVAAGPSLDGALADLRKIGVSPQIDLLEKWLCRHLDIDCQVPNITSVGQTALFTAAGLGLEPIVLVGMDLAFPEGLDHAKSTVFRSRPRPENILSAAGVEGRKVSSQAALIADKVQIEKVITEIGSRVINTSMQGVLLKGTEVRSLSEVVECGLNEQVDVVHALKALDWKSPITISEIIHAYQVMLDDLSGFSHDCEAGRNMVERFFNIKGKNSKKNSLAKKVVNFFEKLKNRWADVGNLLSAARFKEYQELKRCQVKLARDKTLLTANEVIVAEMVIIRDDLDSLLEAGDSFARLLQVQLDYYQGLYQLSTRTAADGKKADVLLKSAEVHLLGKQYWRAENNYQSVVAKKQNRLASLSLLADLYCDLGLWVLLQDHLQRMDKHFPEANETKVYHEKLKGKILDMFEDIKKNWSGALAIMNRVVRLIKFLNIAEFGRIRGQCQL
ncbi:motility associated factor glycosyltransferase family protein [bacterium]|nr:motility associated factor glycosyltransferase family protein [bacterium]